VVFFGVDNHSVPVSVHHLTADADVFTANVYLAPGDPTTLVDAGAMPGIASAVAEHVPDLDRVVLTHQHGDHVAELDGLVERFDSAVYAYDDHPSRTHAIADGDTVSIGGEPCQVVHTPGHAPDHVALVGETALYSGDVVVYNDGAFENGSFGRTDRPGQSRERLIESLRRLLDRLPETITAMYAGHGDPFEATAEESVRDVIERALERAERRDPKYDD
jgi:glyoxylase-like metal-dependent hydrolase (beta-lactamase superfamily II)